MFENVRELTIIFFCTWKFALTFPVAIYGMNMSFLETLIYTNIGGIIGVLFFAFLSHKIIIAWDKYVSPRFFGWSKPRTVFTKKRRWFIRIKNQYGLPGIILLNPIIISIPISTFLVVKFYGKRKTYLGWLVIGQIVWSFVYCLFYFYLRHIISISF
jgi:hypothetical protein